MYQSNKVDTIIDPKELTDNTFQYWYLKGHVYTDIIYMENLFCEDDLNKIIEFGNLHVEKQGSTIAGINKNIRRCKIARMFPNIHTEWIYRKISNTVNEVNKKYFKFDLTKLESLQFTKYKSEESGFYDKHIDPILGPYLPENRKLSFVLQLSDPSEYDGGELYLYNQGKPTIFEKRRGGIIFFPSYTLHEVTPVTKGTRYSLVGWAHGPAFK